MAEESHPFFIYLSQWACFVIHVMTNVVVILVGKCHELAPENLVCSCVWLSVWASIIVSTTPTVHRNIKLMFSISKG